MWAFASYWSDMERAVNTVDHVRHVLAGVQDQLRQDGARALAVGAHSLGSRVLTLALADELCPLHGEQHQYLFVAINVDQTQFKARIRTCVDNSRGKCTLYCTANDPALMYSKWGHKSQIPIVPRVGEDTRLAALGEDPQNRVTTFDTLMERREITSDDVIDFWSIRWRQRIPG
eukprot:jgi/Chrzof1/6354/Cz18g05130.t1